MVDVNTVADRIKLTDEQMRQFIVHGFLKFKADVPNAYQSSVLQQIQSLDFLDETDFRK